MANATLSNKMYIDTAGLLTGQRTKIAYILFTPSLANDKMILKETETGADILVIQGTTAKTTVIFRTPEVPLVFGNGIWVASITSGAVATLVTTSTGG